MKMKANVERRNTAMGHLFRASSSLFLRYAIGKQMEAFRASGVGARICNRHDCRV